MNASTAAQLAPCCGPATITSAAAAEPHALPAGLANHWPKTLISAGVGVLPLFLILDYLTLPNELLYRFAVYRIAAVALLLGQHFALRRSGRAEASELHGYAFCAAMGGALVLMTRDLGGFDSGYYVGLGVLVLAVSLLVPWRPVHSAAAGGMLLGMYLAVNALWGGPFQAAALVNNLFFLLAMMLIAAAISLLKERFVHQKVRLRADLESATHKVGRADLELASARYIIENELDLPRRIQRGAALKDGRLGGYEVATAAWRAGEGAAAFSQRFENRQQEAWVAMGETPGRGFESALVTMMTQTVLQALINDRAAQKPSEVFRGINGVLHENMCRLDSKRYPALNIVRLHHDRLAVAGKHQDLLVHRARWGRVETIRNEGTWVGVLRDSDGFVKDLEVPLGEGDTVLLFTSGVIEATNANGLRFGKERLGALFTRVGAQPLPAAAKALLDEVRSFQVAPQADTSIVLLRRSRSI